MASYYYLAAQLPSLLYGQASSMSLEYFKELCREHLEPKDFELLESCGLNPFSHQIEDDESKDPASAPFVDSWNTWEKALRLNLAKFRSQNLKRDISSQEEASAWDTAAIAKNAVTMESPLEAEMYLDKARWDYIDSLEGLDHFSVNAMFAYHLKLSLMERYSKFKEDEGFAEYKRLYASIINNESGEPK